MAKNKLSLLLDGQMDFFLEKIRILTRLLVNSMTNNFEKKIISLIKNMYFFSSKNC
jgi:hypothetical protein